LNARPVPNNLRILKLLLAPPLLALAAHALAEESSTDTLDEASSRFIRDRKRLVEANLPLTPDEAKRFWPLYEDIQRDIVKLTQRRRTLIGEFGENYDAMTDATARKLLVERLDYHEARYRLLKAYLPKFEKVLPGKKLARYFQIESKISASVEAGIAEELPLLK